MAELTMKNEHLLSSEDTCKIDTDDIKKTPKRSRDDLSEDESDDRCIKKSRQEINTEVLHPNVDDSNKNKSIAVMDDNDEAQSSMNNDILEKKSTVQVSNEKKPSKISSEICENMEVDEDKESSDDKNTTLDNGNDINEGGTHKSIQSLEPSIKCISNNNSLESDENEKKIKLGQNSNIVADTIKDSKVDANVLESTISENGEKHHSEKTEKKENNLLKSSKSDDDENDSDNNNYGNVEEYKSIEKSESTGEHLEKITKMSKNKKKEKSPQDKEKYNQDDCNIGDKLNSSNKVANSTSNDSDGFKYDDCHQPRKTKSKLNASKTKVATKLSEKKNNSHDVSIKEKTNSSDDEGKDTDNENEDAPLKNEINKIDIDQNESIKTTSNSEESNDDDTHDEANSKKRETTKKNSKFDDDIAKLKKFINAAGIKVKKYDDLWSNCKSNKQKIDRLKELLEENGVSGRPTLQKCELAKAKREQDREIAELDPKNIISEARITRSMRSCSKKPLSTSSSSQLSSPQQKIRKRIQIVDSDSE